MPKSILDEDVLPNLQVVPDAASQEARVANPGSDAREPLQVAGEAQSAEFVNLQIRGEVSMRDRTQPADSAIKVENPNLRELLSRLPPAMPEAILNFEAADVVILDVDNHDSRFPREAVEAIGGSLHPVPDAWHVTHRAGVKAYYVGPYARKAALLAAMAIPRGLEVEIKQDARHPLGRHNLAPDQKAGEVQYNDRPTRPEKLLGGVGAVDPAIRDRWLTENGMHMGERYTHEHCPINSKAPTSGSQSVVVYEHGVLCFRCQGQGGKLKPHLPSGYAPFSELCGVGSMLDDMVRERVHWAHAELQLHYMFPNLPESIRREIYRMALEEVYGADDPRITTIFSRDLDLLWGEGLWLWKSTREPVPQLDTDLTSSLPYCQILKDGKDEVGCDKMRRFALRHGKPSGYIPVRVARPPIIDVPEGVISLPISGPKYPVEFLDEPTEEKAAFQHIERSFPGLSQNLLKGIICTVFCASKKGGRPRMIYISGPSGAGKGETINLAGTFLGEIPPKLPLHPDEEKFYRAVGTKLVAGHRLLVIDELAKGNTRQTNTAKLLTLSSVLTWRLLYHSGDIQTPCRAAFFFPCVSVPEPVRRKAEFGRRIFHYRLPRKVQEWMTTCGGETTLWRDAGEENALAANSFITHCWRLCSANRFDLAKILSDLGFGELNDVEESELTRCEMYELYEYSRKADASMKFPKADKTFGADWIDLSKPVAQELALGISGINKSESLRDYRNLVKQELEARDWNGELGVVEPTI